MTTFTHWRLPIFALLMTALMLAPTAKAYETEARATGIEADPAIEAASEPSPEGETTAQAARGSSMFDEDEKDEKPRSSVQRLDLQFRFGMLNDDNILNLRDEAIDEFDLTRGESDRFRIASIDDTVYTPELRLVYSTRPGSRKTFRTMFGAKAYRHQENDIRDYERYRFYIQKDLTDTREDLAQLDLQADDLAPKIFQTRRQFLLSNRSRIQLGYYNIAKRYMGERVDDDAPEQTDPREPIRKSAIYDADGFEARYRQRLGTGEWNRFRLDLGYRYENRDYNREFDERDSDRERYFVGLNLFHLERKYYWRLGGGYELTEVESNTSLIGQSNAVGGSIQDDLASERDALRVFLGFYWFDERGSTPLRKDSAVELSLAFGSRDYTTENVLDLSHFGRSDDYFQATLGYGRPLTNGVTIDIFAQWVAVSTDFAPIAQRSRQVEDYDEVVVGLAFNFYTGWRSR